MSGDKRKIKTAFYADFAVSLVLLGALLAWKLLVRGEEPGFLVLILAALLLINAALCLYSAVEIGRGRGGAAAKVWLFLAVFVLFYAAADLVGGAIFIRLTLFHNYPDKYVHHKMPPHFRYLMENSYGDYSVEMVTNNMGFRGRDIGEKKPGTYRIVMLGDSFTMGEGVPDGSTFPLLVEEYLNAAGGRKYEVVNLGVEGYAPVLEYSLLKRMIGDLKPDMVVLNFDMSDMLNEYAYRKDAVLDESGDVVSVDGFPEYERTRENTKDRALRWIRNHLFITGILYETLNMRTLNRQAADPANINVNTGVERGSRMLLLHTLEAPQLKETAEMYSMIEDSILRAKKLCDLHGCTFILSVYPWGHQVSDTEWVPGRNLYMTSGERISDRTVDELGTFAGRNGIDFFNAFPSFRRYSGGERLYFMHDMHWTPAGQKLMAETLDGFIEKEIKKKPAAHVSY
ncbi:MAG TPA: SGNH/GDSL hydrolase family protein [Thermodesulfobacteriota bacterium]|nr:SGNH/GDSL hydrolase family protein [Thermodesulfobacteriota bacterium]